MGHIPRRLFVIEPHLDIQLLAAVVHQFSDGDTAGAHVLHHAIAVLLPGQNQPIDIIREQIEHFALFALRVIFVVGNQGLILVRGGHRLNAGQHIGKNLVAEGGNKHANRFTPGVKQDFRGAVRDIVVLFHDL